MRSPGKVKTMYLRYALFAPLTFLLNLFLWITADIWALIPATFKLKNMPGPLWYFQTHDDWVYGHGWPKPNPPESWIKRWRIAAWWLRRNPGYAFDAYVLGFAAEDVVGTSGVPPTADVAKGQHYEFLLADGSERFGYRRDFHVTERFYIKMWFGWHYRALDGKRHMLKFAFGPKFVKKD